MTTLVLGVIDIPYDNRDGEGMTTTAKVAGILEAKYGVMGTYVTAHKDDIEKELINSVESALEDLFSGAPMRDPFQEATQGIQTGFGIFLTSGEIEGLGLPGVPTKAAIKRRNLRFKKRKKPGYRPSFVDTSTYELSMRAWVKQ